MIKSWINAVNILLIFSFLAAPIAFAIDRSISGTVAQTEHGFVISADNCDNQWSFDQNLSTMVGRSVEATDSLHEGETETTITILDVEVVIQ
ncbi:MAG: hypothetical protein GY874_07525 [Desulfobacteraceae bacterium]|nr:hypothetical protein [Desulfobacteraceae bacterium]